ncbi:MAG: pantothenate kinase, partial [Streblomastix strix]
SYPFPYLFISMGTGTSVIHVSGPGLFSRVAGSTLGGGCFYGLSRLLTGITSFEQMTELAQSGDEKKVNMTVSDIYGGSYSGKAKQEEKKEKENKENISDFKIQKFVKASEMIENCESNSEIDSDSNSDFYSDSDSEYEDYSESSFVSSEDFDSDD